MSWGTRHTVYRGRSGDTYFTRVSRIAKKVLMPKPKPKIQLVEIDMESVEGPKVIREFDTPEEALEALAGIRALREEAIHGERATVRRKAQRYVHVLKGIKKPRARYRVEEGL